MTLHQELTNAGLPVVYATEDGEFLFSTNPAPTEEQVQLASDIALNYVDPVAYQLRLRIRERLNAAKPFAKNIPSWATWTQADWQAYFNANLSDAEADLVTSLAAARVMIKRQNLVIQNLVKMVIAMRDQMWADLPEVE